MVIDELRTPVFLPRRTSWIVGLDLGQAADSTAIAVCERIDGVLDWRTEQERNCCIEVNGLKQKRQTRTNVRHLQRLQLGMSYVDQVQVVKDLLARAPLNEGATLVLDASGVGRPVADLFTAAGLKHEGVLITAGNEVTRAKGFWHVSKTHLISTVDAMLHDGSLKFAAELTEAGAMRDELKDFRRKLSDAGRATYAARTGAHDDLVLAVAIAAWWISRPSPSPVVVTSYWGDVLYNSDAF